MTISYKERLFGAVVLVSLAVIFLPMLFSTESEQENIEVAMMPPVPDWASNAVEFTVPEELRATQSPKATVAMKDIVLEHEDEGEGTTVEMPTLNVSDKGLSVQADVSTIQIPTLEQPAAYSVQLGTFSRKENATQLVKQLRDHGYEAYQRKNFGQASLVRVLVGPRIKKSEAEQLRDTLATEFQLQGIVMPFEPAEG